MKKTGIFLIFIFLISCARQPGKVNVTINLIDNNRSIRFKGLDYAVIADISRDSLQSAWQSLFAVYKMPADTDLKDYQNSQPGTYGLKDSAVVFTPDTPFKKNQAYFVRCYQLESSNTWDYIKTKRKPGTKQYTDLIFKY